MPDTFPYDVFLSHSAKDKAVVRPLAERLPVAVRKHLKVWFDEWELGVAASRQSAANSSESQGTTEKDGGALPSRRYGEMIEAGLEHSRVLACPAKAPGRRRMLCMSAHAFGSDWAQLLTLSQPSTFNYQPTGAPLNKERRFIPLCLDEFVKKITGNPNVAALQRIREFRNRPNPKVVVTVDMLSTGVDIPALEFIVFLRSVKSRILWEQMLGRGTRLCPDINKSKFVVFDCFDGTLIRYFKNVSSFDIEPPGRTPLTLPEVIENIWQNVDRDYHMHIQHPTLSSPCEAKNRQVRVP